MEAVETFWLQNNNERIFIRHWRVDSPNGVIHLLHGMMEHSGFYHEWAKKLNNLGWAVIAHDHPGSGFTVHSKAHNDQLTFKSSDIILDTLHQVDGWIRERYSNQPVVRYGHSMGSFIAMSAEMNGISSDGLILTGSTIEHKIKGAL